MSYASQKHEYQRPSSQNMPIYDCLKDLPRGENLPACLRRYSYDRSNWDQMQYAWMIQGKSLNVPPASAQMIRGWKRWD